MAKSVAATDGKTEKTVTEKVTIQNNADGTVSITLAPIVFIHLSEMLEEFRSLTELNAIRKQETLNEVFKRVISSTPHYMEENLAALGYFNGIISLMVKYQETLFYNVGTATSKHKVKL